MRPRLLHTYLLRHRGADSNRARLDARCEIYAALTRRHGPAVVARHLDAIRDLLNRAIGQPPGRPLDPAGRTSRPGWIGHNMNHQTGRNGHYAQ